MSPPLEGREPRWPAAILAAAHLAGCLYYFPPREIFSGEPLLTSDYVVHFLDGVRVADALRHGSFWDYSTTWAAGAPAGFVEMINSKPFILILACAPAGLRPLAFNLAVLAFLWIFPTLVYLAARQFGSSRTEAATTMLLAMVAWYGSSLFRLFWRGGSVLFPVGTAFALLLAGWLYRLWSRPYEPREWVGPAFGAAVLLWIHPVAAIVAVAAGGSAYIATLRSRGARAVEIAGIASVALAANLPWLWPFLRDAGIRRSLGYALMQGTPDLMLFDFFLGPFHLAPWHSGETAVLAPLAIVSATGLWQLGRKNALLHVLGPPAAAFLFLAYTGSRFGLIADLQPYRFVVPLAVVLAIGGGPIVRMARAERFRPLAAAALLLALALFADRLRVASGLGDYLGAGLGEADRWALAALREHAADEAGAIRARVLLEGDWLTEPVPGRATAKRVTYTFLALEQRLRAEWIGAPAASIGVWQDYASFWRGTLFGMPFASYDKAAFLRVSDLYDIGWVLSIRAETRERLAGFAPEVSVVASHGQAALFRVERAAARLWSGHGLAYGEANRIRFESADGSPSVLKYHWIPGLTASPAAAVRPVKIDEGSPCEFIEIDPPAAGSYLIGLAP